MMVCPCCKGAEKSPLLGIRCAWCVGQGVVDRTTALHYADQTEMLAHGGYIAGDHGLTTFMDMHAEAEQVRRHVAWFFVHPGWVSALV